MNNIPVFDTENGVGTLILKDIPFTKVAYIRIESASDHDTFMDECVSFCKVVGAEKIFAVGYRGTRTYPVHTSIIRMECKRDSIQEDKADLIGVTEANLDQWLQIYREKMKDVPNAAYMSDKDGMEMLKRGDGYFIYEEGVLLGIGIASGAVINLVASLRPGAGKKIVYALSQTLTEDTVQLDVASVNRKAMLLYESLGFVIAKELSLWNKIL